jgi:hypothetical protein
MHHELGAAADVRPDALLFSRTSIKTISSRRQGIKTVKLHKVNNGYVCGICWAWKSIEFLDHPVNDIST